MILVVTGGGEGLVGVLTTVQMMVGVVHACGHHGDAHFLLDSMADGLPNGRR